MVLGEGRDLEARDKKKETRDKMLRVSGFGLSDGSWEIEERDKRQETRFWEFLDGSFGN